MTQLGKYELHEQLGRGGFGTVYRAIDISLGREVALKVLHPQLTTDPDFLERFRNEARLVAALDSPNIVTIYDLGESDGRVYIAMKYLPGGSIRQKLDVEGAIHFEKAIRILKQVCNGLSVAHEQGLIHRDIKPGNILFDKNGYAVVGDFGLAKTILNSNSSVTGDFLGFGTPSYRAPELWRGSPTISPSTDVYALGCLFYELLTNKVLFNAKTTDEIITQHLIDGPQIPDEFIYNCDDGVIEVLFRAISKDPEERYNNAKEFQVALNNFCITYQKLAEPRSQINIDCNSSIINFDTNKKIGNIPNTTQESWLYLEDSREMGPFDVDEIIQLITMGVINKTTKVKINGTTRWIKITETSFSVLLNLTTKKVDKKVISTSWFYYHNKEQIGPVELNEIKNLIKEGVITNATLVWTTGEANWELIQNSSISYLFHSTRVNKSKYTRLQKWYYTIGTQQNGPEDDEQINQLIRQGMITKNTLVWTTGMASWLPIMQTELAVLFQLEKK